MNYLLDKIHLKIKIMTFVIISLLFIAMPEPVKSNESLLLKKIFYTPSQRKKIDLKRYKNKAVIKKINQKNQKLSTSEEKNKSDEQDTITIDGYIKREDGKNVIWYNNTSTLESNNVNSTIKFTSGTIKKKGIHIISSNKKIRIEPGQILNITSGKINDQYKILDSTANVKVEKQ